MPKKYVGGGQGRVRSAPEIRHWLEGLDSGRIEFIKIYNSGDGLDMTWAVYLEDSSMSNDLLRPTQLKVQAATFRQLIEAALCREEVKKKEL